MTLELLAQFPILPDHALWAGVGVSASIVLVVAWRWHRQRPNSSPVIMLGDVKEGDVRESSEYWEELPAPAENRRAHLRRTGVPTAIQVMDAEGKKRQDACVFDRNSGGLRLALPRAAENGAEILLRATNAPGGTPWVRATVCWVNTDVKPHQIGCRFSDRVPWNILLLFG